MPPALMGRVRCRLDMGSGLRISSGHEWLKGQQCSITAGEPSRSREDGRTSLSDLNKSSLALGFAWIAGFVDAVGYLALYRLFTAHMSGNSVGLGVDIAQGRWLDALHRITPIAACVVAAMLGAVIIESAYRRDVRSAASIVLTVELAALVSASAVGSMHLVGVRLDTARGGIYFVVAALLAAAMGFQSVTLRRVGGFTVRTNFVTGVLTNLAEMAAVTISRGTAGKKGRSPGRGEAPGWILRRHLGRLSGRRGHRGDPRGAHPAPGAMHPHRFAGGGHRRGPAPPHSAVSAGPRGPANGPSTERSGEVS